MNGPFSRQSGSETISIRLDVLRDLHAYKVEIRAEDWSSAISRLLETRSQLALVARHDLSAREIFTCHHSRCEHLFEEACTSACRRPGRPRAGGRA